MTKSVADQLEPDDGYQVSVQISQAERVAQLLLNFNIECAGSLTADGEAVLIQAYPMTTAFENGDVDRDLLLAQAFCRYMNTGGTQESAAKLLSLLSQHVQSLALPDGWRLIESRAPQVEPFEHLFGIEGTNRCLVWQEDNYVEETTLDYVAKKGSG